MQCGLGCVHQKCTTQLWRTTLISNVQQCASLVKTTRLHDNALTNHVQRHQLELRALWLRSLSRVDGFKSIRAAAREFSSRGSRWCTMKGWFKRKTVCTVQKCGACLVSEGVFTAFISLKNRRQKVNCTQYRLYNRSIAEQ